MAPSRRIIASGALLGLCLAAAGHLLTAAHPAGPETLLPGALTRTGADGRVAPAPDFAPDPARGAMLFALAACASCHETPRDAVDPAAPPDLGPHLGGGKRIASDFGVFVAPNISSDPVAGVGAWTDLALYNAIARGIGPDGAHLYPAFPWTAYARMSVGDTLDLIAHLRGLPAVAAPAPPSEIPFPFNIRRAVGAWKLLFADPAFVVADAGLSDAARRGRFLVEGPGHCAECHTPRNALGALDRSRWLTGAPNLDGPGRVPDISAAGLKWSEADIAYYLKDGFTPEYDSVGGSMVEVVANTSRLSDADRAAIAAYLKAVPAAALAPI